MRELYPYQKKALKAMKDGCILCGGVGSGKTITSLAYCSKEWKGMDVYVITTARKRDSHDWETELEDSGFDVRLCSVDSWNNINKYEKVKDAGFIFDEQRVVGSGAWVKSFLKIAKVNRWILLSATPGDVWLDYCPVFVANGFFKNRTEFLRKHVRFAPYVSYPKVDGYLGERVLERLKAKILVSMVVSRHTVRHDRVETCEYDKELLALVDKQRVNPFKEGRPPIMNPSEWFSCLRRCVNGDSSRAQALLDVIREKKKVICFYNFDYELEMLRESLKDAGVIFAEWNGHNHEEIPFGDSWCYLVQYSSGAEAWNCIETDTIVFYSLNYSYRILEQARGRIDRVNTPFEDLWYYFLVSDSFVDNRIRDALRNKKDFNEKSIMPLWDEKGV